MFFNRNRLWTKGQSRILINRISKIRPKINNEDDSDDNDTKITKLNSIILNYNNNQLRSNEPILLMFSKLNTDRYDNLNLIYKVKINNIIERWCEKRNHYINKDKYKYIYYYDEFLDMVVSSELKYNKYFQFIDKIFPIIQIKSNKTSNMSIKHTINRILTM